VTGTLAWTGGVLTGAGTTRLLGGATGTLSGGTHTLTRDFENAGTLTWTAGGLNMGSGATLLNQTGALLDQQADLTVGSAGGGATITNAGLFQKSGGTGVSTVTSVVPFTNTGTVDVLTGTLDITSALTHADGAVLQGSGTIDLGNVTTFDGDVNPGTSPGILTLGGSFTPSALSTFNIELNGTTEGTLYDRLVVSGTITLTNATLDVTLGGGFTPQAGNTFLIATGTADTFAATNLPGGLLIQYNAGNVTLTAP
jgi:hypothetical protein